ncbi:MAG: alpha/beta hydrolase [Bacteroidia bacterium]|nr:alpha/beta hydrolase [Bacteroidia bacterium]
MSIKLRLLLWYVNTFRKTDLSISPAQARIDNARTLALFRKIIDYAPIDLAEIRDEQISVRDGEEISVRVYRPSNQQNLPLIVFYHGGGFVLRSIESHDLVCRRISRDNQAVVVSVGYRLAPEHKFPIPHQDCYDATLWAVKHAEQLGANPDELIVMGDSAGGNLATIVSILARDLGGPSIKKQVLIYPSADARLNHPSIDTYGRGYFLTRPLMQWFVDHYKSKEEDILNPLMSPLLTEDLSNLPPTFLCTAALDPLKDEGAAYAKRLQEAGNQLEFKEYPNVIHGFFNMPKVSKESLEAHRDVQNFLAAEVKESVRNT